MKLLAPIDSYLPDTCNMEFIRSVQVLPCDHSGGQYKYPGHSITIRIPKESVTENIDLNVGVVVHGSFDFPDNLRPISAILWLHVQDNLNFQFQQPIEVHLPHYLKLHKDDLMLRGSEEKLGWMLATPRDSDMMVFEKQDSSCVSFYQTSAKIRTKRACYMCLYASKPIIEAKRQYFLVSAIPKPLNSRSIMFFAVYSLDTFIEVSIYTTLAIIMSKMVVVKILLLWLQMIKQKIGHSYYITHEQFTFTCDSNASREAKAKISMKIVFHSASKGWLLTLPRCPEVCNIVLFSTAPYLYFRIAIFSVLD